MEDVMSLGDEDIEYDELSLVQRRKLAPVADALQYTEDAAEDTFDPLHAVAVMHGERSKPLHALYPEIDEDPENVARQMKRGYRSIDIELKQLEQQFEYLDRKVTDHATYVTTLLEEHDLDDMYGDSIDRYMDDIEVVYDTLEQYVMINSDAADDVAYLSMEQARNITAMDLQEKMQDAASSIKDRPEPPDGLQSSLRDIFQDKCRTILAMDVDTVGHPSTRQNEHQQKPETNTDECAQKSQYMDRSASDQGAAVDWEQYDVDGKKDKDDRTYLEALAAFDADPHTSDLDADLLRDMIDWAVNDKDTLPDDVWENGTVNANIQAAGSRLTRNSDLYTGNGVGTRASRNRTVATARHIARQYLSE